jgi:HSP20 family protein
MDRLFDAGFTFPLLSKSQRDELVDNWQGELPVDLYQDKDTFKVRAELPGFRKEDISVEVTDSVLTVTGYQKTATKSDQQDKEVALTSRERRVSRAVSLPENIDAEKINAAYENGVLTVTLPKAEAVKPRRIEIQG